LILFLFCFVLFFVTAVLIDIIHIYALIGHTECVIDLFVPVVWEMDSTSFSNINVYGCNLCHIRHYFLVVYLKTHYLANIIICKIFWLFFKNNLKYSVGKKSCSISGILFRQPEKVVYNSYQYIAVVQFVIPMLPVQR
jgi:hypothetical protein